MIEYVSCVVGATRNCPFGCLRHRTDLADNEEVRERRNQRVHPANATPRLCATAPNQVWTWDITKLLGPKKWTYFYLYVVLDLFSRYVVGWLPIHLLELRLEALVEQLMPVVAEEAEQLALLPHALADAGFAGGEGDGRVPAGERHDGPRARPTGS
jgi:hypothetical protein